MSDTFDLIVIGGGPAGTSAATAAGFLGKRAALVGLAGMLGGAGINTGTLPSKTLRETALVLSGWRSRRLFGVDLSLQREATVGDFMRHSQNVSAGERTRTQERLESCDDLASWSAAGTTVLTDNSDTFQARDNFAAGTAPKRFFRLKVMRN